MLVESSAVPGRRPESIGGNVLDAAGERGAENAASPAKNLAGKAPFCASYTVHDGFISMVAKSDG